MAGMASARIRSTLRELAGEFGGLARDTILLENGGKHEFELRTILDRLPVPGRLLDVGGGVGVDVLALRRMLGDDVEAHLIDRFVEYTPGNRMGDGGSGLELLRRAGVRVVNSDFWPDTHLPYDDDYFDVVSCFDVIEHLPGHPLGLLAEVRRVLRPGGWLILSGPNAVSLMKKVKVLAGRHPYMPFEEWVSPAYYEHYREYTPAEYDRVVELAGFAQRKVVLLTEPDRTRARQRYHHRRHGRLSPTALALAGVYAVAAMVPSLRPAVYLLARKDQSER